VIKILKNYSDVKYELEISKKYLEFLEKNPEKNKTKIANKLSEIEGLQATFDLLGKYFHSSNSLKNKIFKMRFIDGLKPKIIGYKIGYTERRVYQICQEIEDELKAANPHKTWL
jgi:hypothetical protein